MRSPLPLRFTEYGLLGLLVQMPFSGTNTSLWMLGVYGAGGLVLEGLDVLLELPAVLRALALAAAIYALGSVVGWALLQLNAEPLWELPARGGYLRLELAPAWFLLAASFRSIRRGLDRVQEMLDGAPVSEAQPADASLGLYLPHER